MHPIPELTPLLKQLRLSGILDSLEARNREAIDRKLAFTEFLCKHPAISSGFLFLGVRAYVSTIRKRTRAHYFPRHFDRAHTADL
jgi:hypothetical protein